MRYKYDRAAAVIGIMHPMRMLKKQKHKHHHRTSVSGRVMNHFFSLFVKENDYISFDTLRDWIDCSSFGVKSQVFGQPQQGSNLFSYSERASAQWSVS